MEIPATIIGTFKDETFFPNGGSTQSSPIEVSNGIIRCDVPGTGSRWFKLEVRTAKNELLTNQVGDTGGAEGRIFLAMDGDGLSTFKVTVSVSKVSGRKPPATSTWKCRGTVWVKPQGARLTDCSEKTVNTIIVGLRDGCLDTAPAYVLADEASDEVVFVNNTGGDLTVSPRGIDSSTIADGESVNVSLGDCKWQWYVSITNGVDPQMVFKRPPIFLAP